VESICDGPETKLVLTKISHNMIPTPSWRIVEMDGAITSGNLEIEVI